MQTRTVGSLEVSVAGLGCNNFGMRIDAERAHDVVAAALDAGVKHFDTADVYGDGTSEEYLGQALGSRRAEAVITTKVGGRFPEGMRGGSAEWIETSIAGSLRRLGTEYVDLYLLHVPDDQTPIGETLTAFAALIEAGKVREIGCSNFSAAQLAEAARVADELGVPRFVNSQNQYSLLERDVEDEVLPQLEELGITLMPYFPLASGMLTGKYRRGEDAPEGTRLAAWGERGGALLSDQRFEIVERLDAYAREHGHSLLELALGWLAGVPTVASVIAGATSRAQVEANAAATLAWDMSDSERAEIGALAAVD